MGLSGVVLFLVVACEGYLCRVDGVAALYNIGNGQCYLGVQAGGGLEVCVLLLACKRFEAGVVEIVCTINEKIVITVTVIEQTITLEAATIYAGEIYAGER